MATKFTGLKFDAKTVAPQGSFEPVPTDFYKLAVIDGEVSASKKGGTILNLEFSILEGKYAGRKAFDRFNIVNENAQAQEIAQQQLSGICHAIGVLELSDVSQLFNRPFIGKLGIEAARKDGDKEYPARNTFKGAKLDGEIPAASAPSAPASAPAMPPKPAAPTPPPAPAAPVPPPPPAPPAPPAPKQDRKFWLFLNGAAVPMTEEQVSQALGSATVSQGDHAMLDGESVWQTVAAYNVALPAPKAPAAPAMPAAPGAPKPPPWAKK
jgi:hypothetical protein